MTNGQTVTAPATPERKPRDDEIDVHGLTHTGKVRKENQDHFLVCALKKQVVVHLTSLPETDKLLAEPERLAFLAMVADGVGGGVKGAEASKIAVEEVTQYVSNCLRSYYATRLGDDHSFSAALKEGAMQCHDQLLRRGQEDPDYRGMATTLTMFLGVWPRAYLLQVGDSRCYLLRNGELTQITRDQTMAQDLIDMGVTMPAGAAEGPLSHTLSSSIGGRQTAPAVTGLDMTWGHVVLLCSDGLTNHVPDEEIRDRLRSMTSAKQVCEDLLEAALAGGGSDNITVVVGRALSSES